ncbi:MAG: SAM-dependent methyltransferase [Pseudomonadota bacterium]
MAGPDMTDPGTSGPETTETPLTRELRRRIRADGPISVADFMAAALADPAHGYYTTRDPFGATGDFTTAPEISQMFGEVVGVWISGFLRATGEGAILAELGPGRGTLMADARRAVPALGALPLWLVETSDVLRAAQASRLPEATWAASLDELPEVPTLMVANEFLDALPMRQYLATDGDWREVQVGVDAEGALRFGLSGPLPAFRGVAGPPIDGAWCEISAAADATIDETARRIGSHGGAALFIDYGYDISDRPAGPTLQALKGHDRADPLAAPGQADVTWLPDFDALATRAAAAPGVESYVTWQGSFLTEMGIGQRAAGLAAAAPGEADAIADALERLVMADAMGAQFKAMAILPSDCPQPPGFARSACPERPGSAGQDD